MGNKTAKPTPIGDHLQTMCEAAEVSRLSARTVREYARRGEMRRVHIEQNGFQI
jgi:hypothetical protein